MQEERQRGKDRSEAEAEPASSANEDMPVEKILEAELAVEPKTETYVEANMGLNPSSVSAGLRGLPLGRQGPGCSGDPWPREAPRVGGPACRGPADVACPLGLSTSFARPASLAHRPAGVGGLCLFPSCGQCRVRTSSVSPAWAQGWDQSRVAGPEAPRCLSFILPRLPAAQPLLGPVLGPHPAPGALHVLLSGFRLRQGVTSSGSPFPLGPLVPLPKRAWPQAGGLGARSLPSPGGLCGG